MGVGGKFWDLLKPYAKAEGFDFLRDKRVAVDLSFWIVQHENAIKANARKPHLRLTFFRSINLFSKFGAYPVFIVDGTPSLLKSQARITRFFHSSGIELTSLPVAEDVPVERNRAFSKCVQECVDLVKLLGMPVLYAKGEAEALCAQLNSEGHVDACITADSDAFLFGAKCVIKGFHTNSKEPFECYNMSDIEAGLGLKRKHLMLQGIGLETALRFVRSFHEEDILNRLHEIGNGKVSPVPTSIKFVDDKSADNCADIDGNSPRRKQLHCSFCGHPGSKIDHMKFSCKYCISDDDEGCIKKPEGFICGCLSCDVVRKHKDQKRQEIWYRKICHKIAEEPQFPKDEIIEMYLCNDNGYFSANDGPCVSWETPNIEMLTDFLQVHQNWDPSYTRRQMVPMMSTIFLRDMANTPVNDLLFGKFEFDSIKRVKIKYGYRYYVVKWKCAVGHNSKCPISPCESDMQQDGNELDEVVDLLDDSDIPEVHADDGCTFLLTDENMELVRAAFPTDVERFWQEQEVKELRKTKNSTPRSQEIENSSLLNSRSVQLNITEFFRSTKKQNQSKKEELSINSDIVGHQTSKGKREASSSNLSKSVRRRLLFD